MNCVAFEKIVVDLARGEAQSLWLEAATRQSGLQHAQGCVHCARRLKTQQSLQRSLRAVATGDQMLSAPASVETALRAAFRAREAAVPLAAKVIVPTFQESALKLFFNRMKWAFAPIAVTAAIALVAFAVLRAMQPTTPPPNEIVNATPAPTVTVTPPAPEKVQPPLPPPEPEERPDAIVTVRNQRTQVKTNANKLASSGRADRVTVDIGPFELAEPETVSTKDFLVFDYAQNLPPADSVQLMRVRLPRERLAPLGIPLPSSTRNEEFVNADFLVGSDGVPRAIRVANR